MVEPTISSVAVVGTGVIGRSWALLFARAGCRTRLYDAEPSQVEKAMAWLRKELERGQAAGTLSAERTTAALGLATGHGAVGEAVAEVGYVQESGPEDMKVKRAIFAELDSAASPTTILASSTSALDMTEIAAGLPGARRCLVAHPVNPPHVIPAVELLPGKSTDPEVVSRTHAFLASVGQKPVRMNFYLPGFLLNRMQAALVREAIHLVQSGVADVDAVDAVIRDGLGLRWALLGPFGVANTNADAGLREYFRRYAKSYIALMNDLGPTPDFGPELIERLGRGTDAMAGSAAHARWLEWRDRMIGRIRTLKEQDPGP